MTYNPYAHNDDDGKDHPDDAAGWRCLYCDRFLGFGEECDRDECKREREAAARRMGAGDDL